MAETRIRADVVRSYRRMIAPSNVALLNIGSLVAFPLRGIGRRHLFAEKLLGPVWVVQGGGDVDYRFKADQWVRLTPEQRAARCRLLAGEAKKLATNASPDSEGRLSDGGKGLATARERNRQDQS